MRWWVALLLPVLGGCDLVLLGERQPFVAGPFQRVITISPSSFLPIREFPVSVVIDEDPALKAHARTDGGDIGFTLLDGTALPFERVRYDHGSLEAWVKIDIDRQTQFLMTYGGDAVPFQREQVWSNETIAVYHLSEDGSRAEDSTRNGNHLTARNIAPASAMGQVGAARSFTDGTGNTSQELCAPTGVHIGTSSFTFSMWLKAPAVTAGYDMPVYAGAQTLLYPGADLEISPNNWTANISDGVMMGRISLTTKPTGRWAHVAFVVRRNLMEGVGFVDGQKDVTATLPLFGDIMTMALCIGGPQGYGGLIDEVRMYSSAQQEDWFDAEFDNVMRRSTFIVIGDEVALAPP